MLYERNSWCNICYQMSVNPTVKPWHGKTYYLYVIWWRHQMETFPRYCPFVRGIHRSLINSPHKGQWPGALMFSLICAWINSWINNGKAGDLRRHRAHYDVPVKKRPFMYLMQIINIHINHHWYQLHYFVIICHLKEYQTYGAVENGFRDVMDFCGNRYLSFIYLQRICGGDLYDNSSI